MIRWSPQAPLLAYGALGGQGLPPTWPPGPAPRPGLGDLAGQKGTDVPL
ncbi:MAG: hypothetical protein LBP92_10985 [Deltaproteobacteria bacterium]|nr:hypothetical protein [Deltaproteobacteria bacterium]